jgi:hypothetical protein
VVSHGSRGGGARLWVADWQVFKEEYLDFSAEAAASKAGVADVADVAEMATEVPEAGCGGERCQHGSEPANASLHVTRSAEAGRFDDAHNHGSSARRRDDAAVAAASKAAIMEDVCGAGRPWTGTPEGDEGEGEGEVRPMECGVLVHVLTGREGGGEAEMVARPYRPPSEEDDGAPMSFSKWFFQATRNADYEFIDLYSDAPQGGPPLHKWPAFKALQARVFNASSKPRVAVQLHGSVPGIGDSLWELYLHPWRHYLQAKGCELRLTTVLRSGRARLAEDFDASLAAGFSAANISSGASRAMGDFCTFAADNSNAQTKYFISGSPALWPQDFHRLDRAEDAALLQRASKVVKEMAFVGRADALDPYLRLLRVTLGLPRHKLSAPSKEWGSRLPSKDWSKASSQELRCLADGASIDDELYMQFCPKDS